MILGLALAIAAAAVFAYGVALELSVNAFYTGVVVLWFVAPPLASLVRQHSCFPVRRISGSRRGSAYPYLRRWGRSLADSSSASFPLS